MIDHTESHESAFQQSDVAAQINPRRAMLAGLGGLAAGAFLASTANAGPLSPPSGPISSTPGPEPRIPINAQNTPGDGSKLFRITQPGSYYLAGNVQGVSGRIGISIEASNVSIDLMGYALLGVPGSAQGLRTVGVQNDLVIRNGTVSNWGSDGINLAASGAGSNSIIEGISSSSNGAHGIRTGFNAIIRNCVSFQNGASGISAIENATITDCLSRSNGDFGISAGNASCITNCSSQANGSSGIYATLGSTITNCCALSNIENGILASTACLVMNNVCRLNGGSSGGIYAGIQTSGNDNRIEGNNCTLNNRGIHCINSFNFIARNTCSGNGTNWVITPNNVCFVIVAATGSGVSGNSGGASLGSTDPNANFTY